MRVGIDAKSLQPPRQGVARYLEGLLAGCAAIAHPDVELDVITPTRSRRTLPWVLYDLQRATGCGYGVFHFPFYYPPLWPRCPITVAIHDVLVLLHPEWFPRARASPLRLLLPRGARVAAAVLTGSASVADAIAERCHIPRERIRLTGYGVDTRRFAPPSAEKVAAMRVRLALPNPYLLQFGALEPRRGVDLAIAATRAVRGRYAELELVLAGQLRAAVPDLWEQPPWVRRLGWVDDAHLPTLAAGASAVLAPSRGEGFDLPLLEALACGAAVVASDIAVHREHFTLAVELFPSGDAEALAAGAMRVLEDSQHAAALRAAGPRLAAGFTWEGVAQRHIEVWREVARG